MSNDTNHEDDDQHSDDVEPDATDSDQKSGIPRRNFLAAGAATAAGAAVVASGISGPSAFAQAAGKAGRAGNFTNPREDPSGGRGHGRPGQPNFLFIMVDEMRYPVPYESAQLKAWRLQYLKTQNALMRHGVTLRKHSVASCACVPSRASVFTGQYPSLHGAVATDGGGKQGVENDMFWLAPNTLPTMGNYFRQAGYRTFYKGKWHVSEASLFAPGTHDAPLWSFDESGLPVPALEQLYLNANALDPYGFDGWVGPEPHPTSGSNAGRLSGSSAATGLSGRDEAYADQVVRQIQAFDSDRSDNRPWLLVSSFVDPHDIALVGLLAWTGAWLADRGLGQNCGPISPLAFENDLAGVPTADQLFNPAMFARTFNDNLALKPTCQASNQQAYRQYISGIPDLPRYMRYYYTLQQRVDNQMFKVYSALKASRFYENTIVIFTSDHGDYLSSHGNQHQKWYSAYEEIVNVPCVISNPKMFPHPKTVDAATNHVDLIPTMLGLAGLDPEPLRQALSASFTDAQRLIGRNLTPLVTGAVSSSCREGSGVLHDRRRHVAWLEPVQLDRVSVQLGRPAQPHRDGPGLDGRCLLEVLALLRRPPVLVQPRLPGTGLRHGQRRRVGFCQQASGHLHRRGHPDGQEATRPGPVRDVQRDRRSDGAEQPRRKPQVQEAAEGAGRPPRGGELRQAPAAELRQWHPRVDRDDPGGARLRIGGAGSNLDAALGHSREGSLPRFRELPTGCSRNRR